MLPPKPTLSKWIDENHPSTFIDFKDSSFRMVSSLSGKAESEMAALFSKLDDSKETLSSFKTAFDSAIETGIQLGGAVGDVAKVASGAVSSMKDIADKLVQSVDAIANVHPIVKVSWMIVSAGYKLAKDVNETGQGFKDLAKDYGDVLPKLQLYLEMDITAIENDMTKCTLLGNSVKELLACTNELVVIYLKHSKESNSAKGLSSKLGKAWNIGTDKKTLEELKQRLQRTQEELQTHLAMVTGAVILETKSVVDRMENKQDAYHDDIAKRLESVKNALIAKNVVPTKTDDEILLELVAYLKPVKYNPEARQLCGRKWITSRVASWFQGTDQDNGNADSDSDTEDSSEKERQIFWLIANPGCGKSTMTEMIVKRLKTEEHAYLAVFYFAHMTRNSPFQCIQSIAYQLALQDTDVRRAMLAACDSNKEWFQCADSEPALYELFHTLIVKPLGCKPTIICLDALDECYSATRAEFAAIIESPISVKVSAAQLNFSSMKMTQKIMLT
ncbi:hypothetical protein BCR33DRAFT_82252 [Rhizoclosmatium globosum]|uniref:Nephrocystin 3-like N-terminal domain-containing protein n=1 Tax=Rhizoclosmatium globosum TaxID=329046 RepID=A0A1Y2AT61_9FUNG|nr:hypothetical protein BCR33DRAFT_82252 [Rhizoclosmatium globosum]|eukprot:ORY25387.1 hypothetical protein BCR33DRAFT_82252 [Rhizoclosmatium globosum]